MFIASLAIYPVKGLRGIALQTAVLEQQGLQHDRRWAILRADGRVLTQRDLPAMARIDAVPEGAGLRLEAAGHGGVDATPGTDPANAVVWGTHVPTTLANPAASAWLTRVLGQPCRLVHMTEPAARRVTPDLARPGDTVSLADGFPVLVTSTASLAAVNARLAAAVPMDRFRPNLVIDGAAPWAEDDWAAIATADVRLRLASPCSRCAVITLDQRSGTATPRKEPLRTLGLMHRDAGGHITFGLNAIPEHLGMLAVGDALNI